MTDSEIISKEIQRIGQSILMALPDRRHDSDFAHLLNLVQEKAVSEREVRESQAIEADREEIRKKLKELDIFPRPHTTSYGTGYTKALADVLEILGDSKA